MQAGKDYTLRAQEAEAFGDKGLVVQLEDMLRDEMGHSEESERMLRNWPLKLGLAPVAGAGPSSWCWPQ